MTYSTFWRILSCCMLFATTGLAQPPAPVHDQTVVVVPDYTDAELKSRLGKLPKSIVPTHFDPAVRSYINTYTKRARSYTQEMLGRSILYFPLIEKQLQEAGLPSDLRFLPIVESGLRPHAVSRSRAVGLWQFMYATGKEQGLRINPYVDERRDPHASTKAAIQYLTKLYHRYDDWALALAAYNSGPGNVNRAIRRSRSTDYWTLRRHLPKETRSYVPAFIAAMYLWNYYHLHNLQPQYMDDVYLSTAWIKVYQLLSFEEIAQATGTDIEVIRTLNPAYKKEFVPFSVNGYNVVLPLEASHALMRYLQNKEHAQIPSEIKATYILQAPRTLPVFKFEKKQIAKYHRVQVGETIYRIAMRYGCAVDQIMKWNDLRSSSIQAGTTLKLYLTEVKARVVETFDSLPNRGVDLLSIEEFSSYRQRSSVEGILDPNLPTAPKFHKVQDEETLSEIADQYPQINEAFLRRHNDVSNGMPKKLRLRPRTKATY